MLNFSVSLGCLGGGTSTAIPSLSFSPGGVERAAGANGNFQSMDEWVTIFFWPVVQLLLLVFGQGGKGNPNLKPPATEMLCNLPRQKGK